MFLHQRVGFLAAHARLRQCQQHALREYQAAELVVPTTVIAECAWLLANRLGDHAELAFIASVAAGDVTATELTPADYRRCADLLAIYSDLHLGLVDASVIALAERLEITTIATLNHRDFRVVRPAHVDTFELLP